MILTKAYITQVPQRGSNLFKVRVPFFEDNTQNKSIFNALLCTNPSSFYGYNVGDCVYVHFEDDDYNSCVILGKLFINDSSTDDDSQFRVNDLTVTSNASLPLSTKLGDTYLQDLLDFYNGGPHFGGGSGTVSDDDLKEYVKYVKTERVSEEGTKEIFAKNIRCMSGDEYTNLRENWEDSNNNTLYFLTSVPEVDDADI